MDLLKVLLGSVAAILALFLLVKLIGNKQMSEMNLFDYINGITIGSIAAEMATSLENDILMPLTAMIVFGLAGYILGKLSEKSIIARRLLNGRAYVLLSNGKLYKDNFKRAKIDLNEFLAQSRLNGFFRLSDIQTAVFEQNGKISFQPTADARPLTPSDMKLIINEENIAPTVIEDGKVLHNNLKSIGKDEAWLKKQLEKLGISKIKDVFLALANDRENLSAYKYAAYHAEGDVFE